MWRTVLGIVAGLVAWVLIGTVGLWLMHVTWPAYALVESSMTFTLPMQLGRLGVGVLSSIGGGCTAVLLARGASPAAWWLGTLLVLIFIPIHYGLWDKFPVWYHLFFLLTLAPFNALGGRIAPRTRPGLEP